MAIRNASESLSSEYTIENHKASHGDEIECAGYENTIIPSVKRNSVIWGNFFDEELTRNCTEPDTSVVIQVLGPTSFYVCNRDV